MLELPFVGIREGGELVAAAGTIILSERLGGCHVGHFLTHPAHRGRGLARAAARGLLEVLAKRGIRTFMLGVTEDNLPARRVYEGLGFVHTATRENAFLESIRPV
jgi:ribosomal protein S18 acetylase RimI-like enzyme